MPRTLTLVFALSAFLAAAAPSAGAQDSAALQRLAEPRTHAVMRHALAPGTGDPADFALGDCSTQRNLNAAGRDQARAIGAAMRDAGVEFDRVMTSQWCRCRETAELLDLGKPADEADLNSFYADSSTREAQTTATRRLLAALPEDETVMLVTHQVNITALTGVYPRSGEIIVLRIGEDGAIEALGRFLIPD